MKISLVYAVLCALMGCLGLPATAWTATYYVCTNGNNSADGLSWATAKLSIHAAVQAASTAGDTVILSNGTYVLTNTVNIAQAITVRSVENDFSTVLISGGGTYRGFYVTAAATLQGLTISNCVGSGSGVHGGGVRMTAAGFVTNCLFVDNLASGAGCWGGGLGLTAAARVSSCFFVTNQVDNRGGGGVFSTIPFTLENCVFSNNVINGSGGYGGGGVALYPAVSHSTTMVVWRCSFLDNVTTGGSGAGFYSDANAGYSHFITLDECTFQGNICSTGSGGAVTLYVSSSTTTVRRCTFVANQGYIGGGLYGLGTTFIEDSLFATNMSRKPTALSGHAPGAIYMTDGRVDRCRIFHNTATRHGGGIVIVGKGVARNCLVVGNEAGQFGGGIFVNGTAPYPQVQNCTVMYNKGGTGGGINLYSDGGVTNVICASNSAPAGTNIYYYGAFGTVAYSCVGEMPPVARDGGGNFVAHPLLAGPGTGMGTNHVLGTSYELAGNSPCLNKGTNLDWMTSATDLAGQSRIHGSSVDLGAYEFVRNLSAVFIQIL